VRRGRFDRKRGWMTGLEDVENSVGNEKVCEYNNPSRSQDFIKYGASRSIAGRQ
jgi:hypothetical protein